MQRAHDLPRGDYRWSSHIARKEELTPWFVVGDASNRKKKELINIEVGSLSNQFSTRTGVEKRCLRDQCVRLIFQ